MFDCTCNTQNSLLLNQHNGDDAPQAPNVFYGSFSTIDIVLVLQCSMIMFIVLYVLTVVPSFLNFLQTAHSVFLIL